jgi:hypothetical protein
MRLWTLHPKYLDRAGLLALWREALLAQAVLVGQTRGYRHHPQLARFRGQTDPEAAIGAYLRGILEEALCRGYRFDAAKIRSRRESPPVPVTAGQLRWERNHLLEKLARRDPAARDRLQAVAGPEPHPLFAVRPGGVEPWEKIKGRDGSRSPAG